MSRLRGTLCAGLLALAAGCAPKATTADLTPARELLAERGDPRLELQGEAADEELERTIDALLGTELTVDAAVRVALLNAPGLQATYAELGISRAELAQASLIDNPVLAGHVRLPDSSPRRANLELGIAQNFLSILMRPARKRLAETQHEALTLRVADAVLETATEVRKTWYELVGARHVARMRGLTVEASRASLEMARRLYEAGNASELELANERSLYEDARLAVAASEARVRSLRERMNRQLGLWGPRTAWQTPDRLPDLPAEEAPLSRLESAAVEARLDLRAAVKDLETIALALGITKKWRWVFGAEIGVGAERETEGQWVTGPEVVIELPLFDRRQARIAGLESELTQAEHRLVALAIEIRSEVRELRDRLVMTRELAAHYRTVVIPLRERIVTLTQERYNYMLAGVFELLLAKQSEYDAYQDYIEAVQDYWITRAELRRALGDRWPGDPAYEEPPR